MRLDSYTFAYTYYKQKYNLHMCWVRKVSKMSYNLKKGRKPEICFKACYICKKQKKLWKLGVEAFSL